MIFTVEGDPDENPKYTNTINCAIGILMNTILIRIL